MMNNSATCILSEQTSGLMDTTGAYSSQKAYVETWAHSPVPLYLSVVNISRVRAFELLSSKNGRARCEKAA